MAKPTLLIQGSSWTVGAYKKSTLAMYDEIVPGGLANLLSEQFQVTNISVQDDFNLGTSWRLREHLKTNTYDKIVVCQNDALMDVDVLTSSDRVWAADFDLTLDQLVTHQIDSIDKYIRYVLNKFYSQLPVDTIVFAGPSVVVDELALANRLRPVQPNWNSLLVPTFAPGYTYSYTKLATLLDILVDLFPKNNARLKEEFLKVNDDIDCMIATWRDNPKLFAYFHPTQTGNQMYYNHLITCLI